MRSIPFLLLVIYLLITSFSCYKKDGLTGDQRDLLLATPTPGEITAIQLQWAQRNLVPTDFHIEETKEIKPSRLFLHMISYRVNGEKQYAGVLVPVTTRPLPVYMFIYGFALSDATSRQNIMTDASGRMPFIYIVPALRGQKLELSIDGLLYRSPVSEGKRNNAFDGAADDAIACLNAVMLNFAEASKDTAVIRGGSRGGTVALLAAARDKRFKRAIGIAFPTDLISQTSIHLNDATYRFQFLDEFLSGSVSLTDARQRLIASSPVFFCKNLPRIQIHYGSADKITPASQGEVLQAAMQQAGVRDSLAFYVYPGRTHENIATNNAALHERIRLFLADMW